jgi:hypothetical protein
VKGSIISSSSAKKTTDAGGMPAWMVAGQGLISEQQEEHAALPGTPPANARAKSTTTRKSSAAAEASSELSPPSPISPKSAEKISERLDEELLVRVSLEQFSPPPKPKRGSRNLPGEQEGKSNSVQLSMNE